MKFNGVYIPLTVPKARAWSFTLYLGDAISIALSTAGTPIKITAYNHGATNGKFVAVGEHTQGAANGIWEVENKTTHTIDLKNSVGVEVGRGGTVIVLQDYTNWTLQCQARFKSGGAAVLNVDAEFTSITKGEVTLSGDASDTASQTNYDLMYELVGIDAGGEPHPICWGEFIISESVTIVV